LADHTQAQTVLHSAPHAHVQTLGYRSVGKDHSVTWHISQIERLTDADPQALLPVQGTLQSRLQLTGLAFAPEPAALKQARDAAVKKALVALKRKGAAYCSALGGPNTHWGAVSIQADAQPIPQFPRPYPILMAERMVPGPVVASGGQQTQRVRVSGTVYCRRRPW